ncbi:MAG: hypothetical protein NC084_04170 [Bacteroides sp.]|nr:hypothetical protein [Eubacterium sp.]MCM1417638.1 hypothetical protein [Roseburia sp.]MCM1461897.1 hypothetical protein [Bacteroides sp.]
MHYEKEQIEKFLGRYSVYRIRAEPRNLMHDPYEIRCNGGFLCYDRYVSFRVTLLQTRWMQYMLEDIIDVSEAYGTLTLQNGDFDVTIFCSGEPRSDQPSNVENIQTVWEFVEPTSLGGRTYYILDLSRVDTESVNLFSPIISGLRIRARNTMGTSAYARSDLTVYYTGDTTTINKIGLWDRDTSQPVAETTALFQYPLSKLCVDKS